MSTSKLIEQNLKNSISIKESILSDHKLLQKISDISEKIVLMFQNKGKLLFCGNGGSAADAQHLASEFSGRYYKDRAPLYSEALHTNTSYLTAVSNDYSFSDTYSRLIQAIGSKNDILIGMSTSGNSKNVVKAMKQAQSQGMITIGFTGEEKGEIDAFCDIVVKVPSKDTPRIQECHMLIGHSICEIVENELF
jgi:D-sedoheptulose 7-phosphate isomerase